MSNFKINDHVRCWKPGHVEHGLKGTVDKVITIEEYGGPAYRGPNAYSVKEGWKDGTDRQWFGGFLPDAMVTSEDSYQTLRSLYDAFWRN